MTHSTGDPTKGGHPLVVILAGGESVRMGSDKAMLRLGGHTLLERIALRCASAGLECVVAGRMRPDDWPLETTRFLLDATPNAGPLRGLATAMEHFETLHFMALACDLALLESAAILWLTQRGEALIGGLDGLIVTDSNGQAQPLFSVYARSALPKMQAYLATGRRSFMGYIASGDFAAVTADEWVTNQLVNINTPEEFARLSLSIPSEQSS